MKLTKIGFSLILSLFVPMVSKAASVVLTSDSLCATYSDSNKTQGWGRRLQDNGTNLSVVNDAVGGETIKNFYNEGKWNKALSKKTDFVFISFGANDSHKELPNRYVSPTNFAKYLRTYVAEARRQQTEPYFVTPPRRCKIRNGDVAHDLVEYSNAMKSVGAELKVGVLDLDQQTYLLIKSQGNNACKKYWYKGVDFTQEGAKKAAAMVAAEAKKYPRLAPYFK